METSQPPPRSPEVLPGPLTPEKVRRAREHTAAVREELARQGVDFSRLADPVDELVKARDAGYRDR
jgi:hypothetical protein